MNETVQHKNNKNIVLGTIVLLIGGLLLMKNLGMISFPLTYYLFTWKTFLILLGIVFMTSPKHFMGGVVLTGLGIIFWMPAVFNYQFSLNQIFWPSLLVLLGIVSLMKAAGLGKKKNKPDEKISIENNTFSDSRSTDPSGLIQSDNK
ncbi:MAG: hypothetical protein GXO86_00855 [Chlorobi bacterium]|nr:hypothetical protein [Chlorobiota bacterium]